MSVSELILILIAYLLGSIPFALIISLAQGRDIRNEGSGNIGATNVYRCIGKGWGITTFVLDALKGLAPTLLLPLLLTSLGGEIGLTGRVLAGCAAILGHMFPLFLRFKGGKGVATGAGVVLGLDAGLVGCAFLAWLLVFAISRTVSIASIAAAITLPIAAFATDTPPLLQGVFTGLGLLVVWRHRSNIQRLMRGEEKTFNKKSAKEDSDVHS